MHKPGVLLAEPDPLVARAVRRTLSEAGLRVTAVVRSTPEALAVCEKLHPRIALVDLAMPGMDDADTLQALRARRPDLVVVAFSEAHMRAEAWDLPIDDFITKPALLATADEERVQALVRRRLQRVAQLVS